MTHCWPNKSEQLANLTSQKRLKRPPFSLSRGMAMGALGLERTALCQGSQRMPLPQIQMLRHLRKWMAQKGHCIQPGGGWQRFGSHSACRALLIGCAAVTTTPTHACTHTRAHTHAVVLLYKAGPCAVNGLKRILAFIRATSTPNAQKKIQNIS